MKKESNDLKEIKALNKVDTQAKRGEIKALKQEFLELNSMIDEVNTKMENNILNYMTLTGKINSVMEEIKELIVFNELV